MRESESQGLLNVETREGGGIGFRVLEWHHTRE